MLRPHRRPARRDWRCALAEHAAGGDRQRRFRAGLSRPGHRHRQARRRAARARAAPPDRHLRSGRELLGRALRRRCPGAASRAIHARGRVPLLVGGTMLYFRALLPGLRALPQACAGAARGARCTRGARGLAGAARGARAARPGRPRRASSPHDGQRIQRALEVCLHHRRSRSRSCSAPRSARSRTGRCALGARARPIARNCTQRLAAALRRHDGRRLSRRSQAAARRAAT